MLFFYFYNPDFIYYLFFLFLIFSLVFFLVLVITDNGPYYKFLFRIWEKILVRINPLLKKPVSLADPQVLVVVHFELFLFFVFINLLVFSIIFFVFGPSVLNAFGSGPVLSINFSSYLGVLCVNFFLILYIFVVTNFFHGITKKTTNPCAPVTSICTYYTFNYHEFILYYIIHFVSFFMFSCSNFISFFICLEILTFSYFVLLNLSITKSTYGFVFPKQPSRLRGLQIRLAEAALIYLLPNLFSSILFLIGVYVLYLQLGVLEFSEMFLLVSYHALFLTKTSFFVFCGLLFIVCSFCIKLSVAPFHNWIILVYGGTRQHTVFFLSTVSKIIYFLLFLKYVLPFLFFFPAFSYIFIFFSVCSLWVGTVHGIFERRFYRLLGYSGILNIGYCFFVLSVFDFESDVLAFYMFFVYCLLSLLVFFCIMRCQALVPECSFRTIDQFKEIPFNSEVTGLMLVLLVFSIIGLPPLPGFFPKFCIGLKIITEIGVVYFCFYLLFVVVSSFFYMRLIAFLSVGNPLQSIKNYLFSSIDLFRFRWVCFCFGIILPLCSPLVCDYLLHGFTVLVGVLFC